MNRPWFDARIRFYEGCRYHAQGLPPAERRERAVEIVPDHLDEYSALRAACQAIGPESLRTCANQAQVDTAQLPGVTFEE